MSDIRQIMNIPEHLVLIEKLYVDKQGFASSSKDSDFSHVEYNIIERAILGLCFYTDGTSDVRPLTWNSEYGCFDVATDGQYEIVPKKMLEKKTLEYLFETWWEGEDDA